MGEQASLDIVVATVVAIAALRGFFLGLVREAFSLGSLCAAYFAVRLFSEPAGAWLVELAPDKVAPDLAPWLGGALVAVGAIALVTFAGRVTKRGVRMAGLSWADRVGGGVLGAAEGTVVAGLLLTLLGVAVGRDHPLLSETRSIATLEAVEEAAREDREKNADVAAAPPEEDPDW